VDDDGNVRDSLIPEFNPREREDKTTRYVQFKDIQLLPLRSAVQFTNEHEQLPSWIPPPTSVDFGEAGAFYFPVQTDKGRRFIIVVLDSAHTLDECSRAAVVALSALHSRRVVCNDTRHGLLCLALHSANQGTLNRRAKSRRRQL
jgi:hypothetical protein